MVFFHLCKIGSIGANSASVQVHPCKLEEVVASDVTQFSRETIC
jgi:hypothetical protein